VRHFKVGDYISGLDYHYFFLFIWRRSWSWWVSVVN